MKDNKVYDNKNGVVLYNIFLPIWLLPIWPPIIFITLPINYIIDYVVCRLSLRRQKVQNYKMITNKLAWKIWIVGFMSDFVGIAMMIMSEFMFNNVSDSLGKVIYSIEYNCFSNPFGFLYVVICLVVSAILIYFLNLKVVLKKVDTLNLQEKKKLCLHLAIFTAPYLFLIPTSIR